MSTDLLNDEASPAVRAFERAAAPTWDGALIKPFSARRLIAAESCGLRILKELARMGDGARLDAYDGIFWDAVLVVFLCLAENRTVLLAVRNPEAVCEQALAWADEQKLTPDSPKFSALVKLFGEIMNEIMTSTTEPNGRADGEPGPASPSEEQKKISAPASTGSPSSPSRSEPSPGETPRTSS